MHPTPLENFPGGFFMTFLYLNSNVIGSGTDCDLGSKLLYLFPSTLAASTVKVDIVSCVNGGVFLTTRDGPALEGLRALLTLGARIASCGTCLNHLGPRGALISATWARWTRRFNP